MNAGQQQEARGNALKWAYSAYACAYAYAYAKGHENPEAFATSFQEARDSELQREEDALSREGLGILRALGSSPSCDDAYNEKEKELYAIWHRAGKLAGKLRFGQDPESMAGLDRHWLRLERGKG